jgi:hypothetical protein
MSGLSNISTFDSAAIEEVKAIKAAIFAYSISRIAVDLYGANYTQSQLESMTTIEAAIAAAVNAGISDTLLIQINNKIDYMNATLESYGLSTVPRATADQVSRSAFNIAQYIAYNKINNSSGPQIYDWWPVGFDTKIGQYGQSLGMRYYFLDNYAYGTAAPLSGPPPDIAGKKPIVIALEQGHIEDGFSNVITTPEVNPGTPDNVVGFDITNYGTVESLY